MTIMTTRHTTFAKHLNIIVTKESIFGGNIRDKGGIFVNSYYAHMMVITLAFMSCILKNFLFSIIVKPLQYSYHNNTSLLASSYGLLYIKMWLTLISGKCNILTWHIFALPSRNIFGELLNASIYLYQHSLLTPSTSPRGGSI